MRWSVLVLTGLYPFSKIPTISSQQCELGAYECGKFWQGIQAKSILRSNILRNQWKLQNFSINSSFSFLCNNRFKWQLVSTMHNFLTISRERTFLLSWEVRRSMPVYEETNRIGSWLTGRRQECLFSKTWVKRELSPGSISNDWFNYKDVSH